MEGWGSRGWGSSLSMCLQGDVTWKLKGEGRKPVLHLDEAPFILKGEGARN